MQSSTRLWTASEKTELIEQAAKAAVMDAQPLAQWTRVGMRGFLNHYGFPSFSWQAVDNARKSQYEKWVTEVKRVSEDERVKQKMSDRQVTTLEALELDDLDDVF